MMRRTLVPVALVALALACTRASAPAPAPAFELRPVVAPALAALEAELAPSVGAGAVPPAADDAALLEELGGLVQFAASATGALRDAAVEEARGFGDAAAPHLAAVLGEPSRPDAERRAAADLLAALDTPLAQSHLLAHVESSPQSWLRAHCAWLLGRGAADWTVPRLVLRLKYESDHQAALWMADALVSLGNYSGLDTLQNVATLARSETVRAEAAARIQALTAERGLLPFAELREVWYRGDPQARLPHFERSARYRREVWRLIAQLDDFQLRGVDDARFVLARLGEETAECLALALHDESAYVRLHSAQALERMGPRGAVAGPALCAALAEPALAPTAAVALGRMEHTPAEPLLTALLARESDADVRVAAARGLGYLGKASSIPALAALLDAGEPADLEQVATESLLFAGDTARAVPRLIEYLADPRVDPATSEGALSWWFARRAERDEPGARDLLARWQALEPAAGLIEPPDHAAARRRERADLARAALAALRGE